MKKCTLKTSKLILCALLTSAYASQATPEHDDLTNIVIVAHDHFRQYAIPWSNRFFYSSSKLRPLIDEFNRHLNSFKAFVVEPLKNLSATERGGLTDRAKDIMNDLKNMIEVMSQALSELTKCTSQYQGMVIMKQAQTAMNGRLATVENKIRDFKYICDKNGAQRLRSSIMNLERIIFDFKNSNNNMAGTLMKRMPVLIS